MIEPLLLTVQPPLYFTALEFMCCSWEEMVWTDEEDARKKRETRNKRHFLEPQPLLRALLRKTVLTTKGQELDSSASLGLYKNTQHSKR